MANHGILTGKITPKASLVGIISKAKVYYDGYSTHETYEGKYEVTPKVEEQCLETKDKLMKDNVNIKSIPFFSVSNETGGNTVYIGKEV